MKAIVQDRYGGADTLKLADAEMPVADATSVILRVRSASVNGLDWRIMSGRPVIGRLLGFGLTRPKRRIRGVDVAGEVIAVRKSDSRFKVGDAVFGLGSGSFAEYVAADEREITNKPAGVSFDDAATLGIAAFTALQGLRDRGHVQAGQSVAITAAGSGVGTFAVQLAKWMGARVTAITRTENVETLRRVGADVVIDYRTRDFTQGPDRYDVIVDLSGLNGIGALVRTLTPGGTLVVVGGRGGFGRFIQAGVRRRLLGQRVLGLLARPNVEDMAKLGGLVAEGKLKPVIDHVYPLEGTPEAMTRAERHEAQGKLVIHVS
jgi:NADPH:quinone reductase-like Zn-dependent oxidoreductase